MSAKDNYDRKETLQLAVSETGTVLDSSGNPNQSAVHEYVSANAAKGRTLFYVTASAGACGLQESIVQQSVDHLISQLELVSAVAGDEIGFQVQMILTGKMMDCESCHVHTPGKAVEVQLYASEPSEYQRKMMKEQRERRYDPVSGRPFEVHNSPRPYETHFGVENPVSMEDADPAFRDLFEEFYGAPPGFGARGGPVGGPVIIMEDSIVTGGTMHTSADKIREGIDARLRHRHVRDVERTIGEMESELIDHVIPRSRSGVNAGHTIFGYGDKERSGQRTALDMRLAKLMMGIDPDDEE